MANFAQLAAERLAVFGIDVLALLPNVAGLGVEVIQALARLGGFG